MRGTGNTIVGLGLLHRPVMKCDFFCVYIIDVDLLTVVDVTGAKMARVYVLIGRICICVDEDTTVEAVVVVTVDVIAAEARAGDGPMRPSPVLRTPKCTQRRAIDNRDMFPQCTRQRYIYVCVCVCMCVYVCCLDV
jgi:hypothetical protein